MRKQIRLRKLLVQYIKLQNYWQEKSDYYFSNNSYYLLDYEIEDKYEPLFNEACENKNIFPIKVEDLKKN